MLGSIGRIGSFGARPASPSGGGGGGGGGDGSYVAKAVHFNGTTTFGTASLSSDADSGLLLVSVWALEPAFAASQYIFMCDGGGNYTNSQSLAEGGDPSSNGMNWFFADATVNNFIQMDASYNDALWHHWLVSLDTNHPAGQKLIQVYKDDVDVTHFSDTHPEFVMKWNGISFAVGSAGDGDPGSFLVCDLADLRIVRPTAFYDLSITDNRRIFIDASRKPVNPSVATASLGTAGDVLCSGNHTTFSVNQGSGGAFTLTGALTNASTSPSDDTP